MIEVKDLLGKFDRLLFLREDGREAVRQAISEALGIEIAPEDIEIKKNTIFLNLKPIYKNEIFLKREFILEKLQKNYHLR